MISCRTSCWRIQTVRFNYRRLPNLWVWVQILKRKLICCYNQKQMISSLLSCTRVYKRKRRIVRWTSISRDCLRWAPISRQLRIPTEGWCGHPPSSCTSATMMRWQTARYCFRSKSLMTKEKASGWTYRCPIYTISRLCPCVKKWKCQCYRLVERMPLVVSLIIHCLLKKWWIIPLTFWLMIFL